MHRNCVILWQELPSNGTFARPGDQAVISPYVAISMRFRVINPTLAPSPGNVVSFGEVGLSGEIRPVPDGEQRLKEAAGHGFERAIVPAANTPRKPPAGLEIVAVRSVRQALEQVN